MAREPRHFIPVKNKPGELIKIDKRELRIDAAYQRPVNQRAVNRIANNWSWLACGSLVISFRPDGKGYFIIDGQHRWEAAKKLNIVTDLPCLVFELDVINDEAIGFLAANAERQNPKVIHKFNALLLAGDPLAKKADQLARSIGRYIGVPSDKTHISCVGVLMRLVNEQPVSVERVWPVIGKICVDAPILGQIIRGIVALESRMPSGFSLSDPKLASRLVSIGPEALSQSMRAVVAIEGRSSEKILAQGILRAINKGVRNPVVVDMEKRYT
jgi:hypothetical protein